MSCLKHKGRKHLFPALFYDGAVSKAISIQPPFLASKALRRCGLLRKSKEGPACAMAPAAIFPFSHYARKSFRMLWPAATNLHSGVTFSRPLGVNLVNPRFLLTSPNTVSTSTERLFRKADPISVRSISPARLLEGVQGRVRLDPLRGIRVRRLRAPRPAGAARAVLALVCPHRALVAQARHPPRFSAKGKRPALRAGVLVGVLVVRPVGDPHLVVAPFLVAALAEEPVVLDVGVCALALEVGVVLLAAVAGVGHEACGQAPDPLLDVLTARDGAGRVYYMRRSKAVL